MSDPFPPGNIPIEELVSGTIYKYVQTNLTRTRILGWDFTRFVGIRPDRLISHGIWTTNPDPELMYQILATNRIMMHFYPIMYETGDIPKLGFANPPPAELLAGFESSAWTRRRNAVMTWHNGQNNSRRGRNRRNRKTRRCRTNRRK